MTGWELVFAGAAIFGVLALVFCLGWHERGVWEKQRRGGPLPERWRDL